MADSSSRESFSWLKTTIKIQTSSLGLTKPLLIRTNAAPIKFQRLCSAQVSSIPIVDDNDSLLDIYCHSDITALAKDRAYAHINLNEMTIHQMLTSATFCSKLIACVLTGFSGVRRIVVVEAGSKRVEGIVALSDIFKFLLG